VLVDKPAGLAFASVVKAVKRKFNLVKVGHAGSLQAMASGLLVLAVGDANRLAADVMGADRAYTGAIRLGLKTNTGDVNGEPLASGAAAVDLPGLEKACAGFRGDVFQTEPRFSAIRREMTAGYDIVDTGEHAQFLSHIYRFRPVELVGTDFRFELVAAKGVLVRALADDLGTELKCGAALTELRRLRQGAFDVAEAIAFERLLELSAADFAALVRPLAKAEK